MNVPAPHSEPPPRQVQAVHGRGERGEGPWGDEEPLGWYMGRARRHTLWGSAAVATLLVVFGAGVYSLFTIAIYEGNLEDSDEAGGILLMLVVPFLLGVVGTVAAAALARTASGMQGLEGAHDGVGKARVVLYLSAILWGLLLLVYPLSLTITEGDFPIGLLTVLPVYLGLCVAVYTTGAALVTWSGANRLEAQLATLLGWAAFGVFLILPYYILTWDLESSDWETIVFWVRFGLLFGALLPVLIVVALMHVHRGAMRPDVALVPPEEPPATASAPLVGGDCEMCGGRLVEHQRTREAFCPVCGWGLGPEQETPWPPV